MPRPSRPPSLSFTSLPREARTRCLLEQDTKNDNSGWQGQEGFGQLGQAKRRKSGHVGSRQHGIDADCLRHLQCIGQDHLAFDDARDVRLEFPQRQVEQGAAVRRRRGFLGQGKDWQDYGQQDAAHGMHHGLTRRLRPRRQRRGRYPSQATAAPAGTTAAITTPPTMSPTPAPASTTSFSPFVTFTPRKGREASAAPVPKLARRWPVTRHPPLDKRAILRPLWPARSRASQCGKARGSRRASSRPRRRCAKRFAAWPSPTVSPNPRVSARPDP